MTSIYAGTLTSAGLTAEIRLEPGDLISVTARLERCRSAAAALRINRSLPGNLRLALGREGPLLLADTRQDGAAHLPATFRQLRRGLAQALGPGGPGREEIGGQADTDRLRLALDEIDERALGERPVQRPDDLWELRPRFAQAVVPVLLEPVPGGVRLWRELLPSCAPGAGAAVALGLEALRLNAELREARLAAGKRGIVVETRLHSEQLDNRWLPRAAQAVAAAWNHAQPTLRALAEQADLSALYLRMFCGQEQELRKGKQQWQFSRVSH